MDWIAQLLIRRRRKNQRELARRAVEVVSQVIYDVGVDRFRKGTLLVDYDFRIRFVTAPVYVPILAEVPVMKLAHARALPLELDTTPLGTALLRRRIWFLVRELMTELLAQSEALRELPNRRQHMPDRSAAASK